MKFSEYYRKVVEQLIQIPFRLNLVFHNNVVGFENMIINMSFYHPKKIHFVFLQCTTKIRLCTPESYATKSISHERFFWTSRISTDTFAWDFINVSINTIQIRYESSFSQLKLEFADYECESINFFYWNRDQTLFVRQMRLEKLTNNNQIIPVII